MARHWDEVNADIARVRAWLRRSSAAAVRARAHRIADGIGASGETRRLLVVVLLRRWAEAKGSRRGERD